MTEAETFLSKQVHYFLRVILYLYKIIGILYTYIHAQQI